MFQAVLLCAVAAAHAGYASLYPHSGYASYYGNYQEHYPVATPLAHTPYYSHTPIVKAIAPVATSYSNVYKASSPSIPVVKSYHAPLAYHAPALSYAAPLAYKSYASPAYGYGSYGYGGLGYGHGLSYGHGLGYSQGLGYGYGQGLGYGYGSYLH